MSEPTKNTASDYEVGFKRSDLTIVCESEVKSVLTGEIGPLSSASAGPGKSKHAFSYSHTLFRRASKGAKGLIRQRINS